MTAACDQMKAEPRAASEDFLNGDYKKKSDRAACEEIKYAIKEYVNVNMPKDPEFVARISEHLETLLATFKNNWKELEML